MTEAEWLNENSRPQWMTLCLGNQGLPRTKAGRRKLRLFACGCCRVVWDILPDDRLRAAVGTAERFADGLATKEELAAARATAEGIRAAFGPVGDPPSAERVVVYLAFGSTVAEAYSAAVSMTAVGLPLPPDTTPPTGEAYRCDLLRCVFGNPFRPVVLDRGWRSSTAVELARGIYEDRAFDRLPVLADALQDAGCENADLLAHCRGNGPHIRGCWVIDLVLGKA